jgi:hypothetical protein
MLDRLRVHAERTRASLFFVPALFVGAAMAVAGVMLQVDVSLSAKSAQLPTFLQTAL